MRRGCHMLRQVPTLTEPACIPKSSRVCIVRHTTEHRFTSNKGAFLSEKPSRHWWSQKTHVDTFSRQRCALQTSRSALGGYHVGTITPLYATRSYYTAIAACIVLKLCLFNRWLLCFNEWRRRWPMDIIFGGVYGPQNFFLSRSRLGSKNLAGTEFSCMCGLRYRA